VQSPEERKEAVLAKMMPLHNRSGAELATEESISTARLYNWRRDACEQGRLLPQGSNEPEGRSARQVQCGAGGSATGHLARSLPEKPEAYCARAPQMAARASPA